MMANKRISRLLKDRSGNFGMMTAILLPVLIGAGGVALDLTNMMMSKTQLQEAADSAALAASTALATGEAVNEAAAKEIAKQFFIAQMGNSIGSEAASEMAATTNVDIKTTTTSAGTNFEVSVGSSYDVALTPLMGVLGYQTMNIATNSTSTSGISEKETALSMALVLDESGSMDWNTTTVESKTCKKKKKWSDECKEWDITYVKKIAALKMAANALFSALDDADPEGDLTRTGAVSYNHNVMGQTQPLMGWGTSAARTYIAGLPEKPEGGTDASGAMQVAHLGVQKAPDGSDSESEEHGKKENETVERFIVLMTDGEMTGYSNQWNPTIDGAVRDRCDDAKEAKTRIFTVAFMAPDKGKQLLRYCASTASDYYEPETMEQLVSDFSQIAKEAVKARTLLTH
ncbi:MAG TPA: TadE/TadG family type IV pilus assembly protein [Pseudorhizobium sp.]|nr:TadE/TadG family type IV pilus assembly protein [Pseudorhizobium sp.]